MNKLDINGNVYTDEDVMGKGYVRAFPNIAQDLYDSYFNPQVAICRQTFTVSLGTFTFKVDTNKAFYRGMKFATFQLPFSTGEVISAALNPPVFSGEVLNYDKGTGSLSVEIDHMGARGTFNKLFFAVNLVSTAPIANTIANGLTASAGLELTRRALRVGDMGLSFLRNGLGPLSNPTLPPPYYASLSGTASVSAFHKDVYGASGVMSSAISLVPGTGRSAVYIGRKPWLKYAPATSWGYFKFRSPSALADVTNNYKVSIGFRGYGSTEATPLGHSGMGVTYNYAENGGNWISRSGNNGSVVTNNSATAFAANTEYEVLIRAIGSDANFVVNGTSIATLTDPYSAVLNNYLHPFIMIERLAGTSPSMFAEEINLGGF